MTNLLSPDEWFRAGRGRGFECDLRNEELVGFLENLPAKFGDYGFFVTWLEQVEKRRWERRLSQISYADIPKFVEQDIWQFFLASGSLEKKIKNIPPDVDILALNGAISIQHHRTHRENQKPTVFGFLNRVEHDVTGVQIIHEEQEKLFNWMKRKIQSRQNIDPY